MDPHKAVGRTTGRPIELGLVLRDGDRCLREAVRVEAEIRAFEGSAIEAATLAIPPHLDPPLDVPQRWLDDQLAKHAFIVLLFYRVLC